MNRRRGVGCLSELRCVCQCANAVRRGNPKGDRVAIYMPMVPEAVMAMLARTRIGAVHSVISPVFRRSLRISYRCDCRCLDGQ